MERSEHSAVSRKSCAIFTACHAIREIQICLQPKNQPAIRSANSLITSSNKRKNLGAMSAETAPPTMPREGHNSQEKRALWQQRKLKPSVLTVINFFVLIVLTSFMLWNKGLKKSIQGRTDDILCLTSSLRKKQKKALCYAVSRQNIAWPTGGPHRGECVKIMH